MIVVHIETVDKEGLTSKHTIIDYFEGMYHVFGLLLDDNIVKISVEKYDTAKESKKLRKV